MDGFVMHIFGIVIRDLHREGHHCNYFNSLEGEHESETSSKVPNAKSLLVEALRRNPCNWSCWLDLADICMKEGTPPPSWPFTGVEHKSNHVISLDRKDLGYYMYQFFLVHINLEQQLGNVAYEILQELAIKFPSSEYVAVGLALAHYSMRNYDLSQVIFEGVRERDPYRLENLDTYSNILYVKENKSELSHLSHLVSKVNKFAPETCCIIGNYYSLKGQHEKSVLFFRRAVMRNSKYLSAWTLMGHECVELRNTSAAVQCYRKAIDACPFDYRAWYGLGQTYEMLHLYQYSLYYYKKASFLRPTDSRMWCAVGNCLLKLGMKSQAIKSFEYASNGDSDERWALMELARLHREEGRSARAAFYYYKFMFIAGVMLSNLVDLYTKCEKCDDYVSSRAVASTSSVDFSIDQCILKDIEMNADKSEALLYLASFCKNIGQYSASMEYCSRLLDFGGPESVSAKALLREMRNLENPSM